MKLTGKVWKFPQDDINTGLIRKQMYNHLPPQEQGRHCMEALDPEFSAKVQPGDFIVAGTNFGCGSSTPAHYSIVALGIPAVYVPLPIGNGEQRLNARPVVDAGGGLLVADADLTPERVRDEVLPLLTDPARLSAMAGAAASVGVVDAAARVADLVEGAAEGVRA